MTQTLNLLFLAAEAEPFVKVGGLGDVAGSLPRALRALSNDNQQIDARLVLPYHSVIKADPLKSLGIFSIPFDNGEIQVEAFETLVNGMPVYLINGEPIRANGSVYSSNAGMDTEKYAFFSLAALELTRHINWQPQVIHANDWHTALSVYASLARSWEQGARRPVSVLTLHNLPFMGADVGNLLERYHIKLAQTDLPDWARVLPLPLGLWAADAIVPVSESYGQEILTPEYGCGLQEFLRVREDSIHGILNGLDVDSFNPAIDSALTERFSIETLDARAANKTALQEKLDLPFSLHIPLFGMVSRMDIQKGVDLVFSALKNIKALDWQAVILASGDIKLEQEALALQESFPNKVKVITRYDATLARQIYSGADALLMPSRYEPCGLSQMIAMRYGCLPIVRATGGLKDTVLNGQNGFVFEKTHHLSLAAAIKTALKTYQNQDAWRSMQRVGMAQNFSWGNSAQKYLNLYQTLLNSKP